jgi:hypothetical protein
MWSVSFPRVDCIYQYYRDMLNLFVCLLQEISYIRNGIYYTIPNRENTCISSTVILYGEGDGSKIVLSVKY